MNNACNGGVVLPQGDGTVSLALFRTEDAVKKFRTAQLTNNKFIGPCVKFNWDHELLLYLNALPAVVTQIGVAPEMMGGMYMLVPVSSMKAQLQKSIDDPKQP